MKVRFLIVLSMFFFVACSGNRQPEAEKPELQPAQYYYFPKANVYFDSANKDYLFLAADSNGWQTSKQVPAVVHSLMDKSVYIADPAQPVWKDNDKHKLVYSALLYATPNDTVEKKELPKVVTTKPAATAPTADSASEASKKRRTGVGRFLDKLFGGLKKKKKDSTE